MATIRDIQRKIKLLRAQEKFCMIAPLLEYSEKMMDEIYGSKEIRSFATTDYTLYVKISTQRFGSLIGKKSYMVKREDEDCGFVFDDLREAVELLTPHLLNEEGIRYLNTTIRLKDYELKLNYAGYEVKPVWYNF